MTHRSAIGQNDVVLHLTTFQQLFSFAAVGLRDCFNEYDMIAAVCAPRHRSCGTWTSNYHNGLVLAQGS